MSMEEFLARINNFEELEKHYEKLYKAFSQKLPGELTEVVFNHLPDMLEKRDIIYDDVYKTAEKYIREIWESYNNADSCNYSKTPVKDVSPVPKPKTREEAEKELQSELEETPEKYHELYKKTHWECYEDEKPHEMFLYAVFNKMKEVLVEYYMNDILKLEADYLRILEQSIYYMCAIQFVQEIYKLEEN